MHPRDVHDLLRRRHGAAARSARPCEGKAVIDTVHLEIRGNGGLEVIGSCSTPIFDTVAGEVKIERAVVHIPPQFRLKQPEIIAWLAKRDIMLTRCMNNGYSHSTTSWVCLFKSCASTQDLAGMHVLTDLVLEI
jgi:hypothetical protein